MKNKFLFILLILTCSIVLFSCGEKTVEPTTKEPTQVAPTPTPTPTEPTEEVVDNRYSVKVVCFDENANLAGITVQWCVGDMCFLPQPINAEGVAYIELEDGEYYIHLNNVPEGYTYNPNAYITTADSKHVDVLLYSINSTTGDGSKASPYNVSKGAYSIEFTTAQKNGMKYFSFTPSEAGTYYIESMCMDKLALSLVDPYIGFLGTDINSNPNTEGNDIKDSVNFVRSFQADANTTYYFIIMISSVSDNKFPCKVDFTITQAN